MPRGYASISTLSARVRGFVSFTWRRAMDFLAYAPRDDGGLLAVLLDHAISLLRAGKRPYQAFIAFIIQDDIGIEPMRLAIPSPVKSS